MKTVPNPAENTRYGYKNDKGHILHIATIGHNRDHVELAIKGVGDLTWRSLNIPQAEAAGVALAILKAAGFVPRGNRIDSDSFQESVDTAAGYLDDAVLIADCVAAKKELTRRRDKLAERYFRNDYCDLQFPSHRAAIDDIIKLQDEASK